MKKTDVNFHWKEFCIKKGLTCVSYTVCFFPVFFCFFLAFFSLILAFLPAFLHGFFLIIFSLTSTLFPSPSFQSSTTSFQDSYSCVSSISYSLFSSTKQFLFLLLLSRFLLFHSSINSCILLLVLSCLSFFTLSLDFSSFFHEFYYFLITLFYSSNKSSSFAGLSLTFISLTSGSFQFLFKSISTHILLFWYCFLLLVCVLVFFVEFP